MLNTKNISISHIIILKMPFLFCNIKIQILNHIRWILFKMKMGKKVKCFGWASIPADDIMINCVIVNIPLFARLSTSMTLSYHTKCWIEYKMLTFTKNAIRCSCFVYMRLSCWILLPHAIRHPGERWLLIRRRQ